jgi:hypothetical protein
MKRSASTIAPARLSKDRHEERIIVNAYQKVRSKSLGKIWRWGLMSLILILVFGCNVLADDYDEILEAESVYQQCLAIEDAPTTEEIIMVRQLLEDDEIGDWEKYSGNEDAIYNDECHLFFVGKRLSSARIYWGTPTGDWAEFTYYYYREEGTLAYIINDYRTLCDGEMRIISRCLFNAAGKQIKVMHEFYDLFTDEPIDGNDNSISPPQLAKATQADPDGFI